ncbi:MAG: aldehyde dehydrogenase [Methylococcaceae bacterium]|nr:aldehyde dehydrogenase [Methylococcaceae bacterium]
MSISIGIVGLGRVGRSILRTNFIQSVNGRFNICAICDVMPISQVAYLIAHDSTYGRAPFSVDFEGDYLVIAGKKIRYLQVDRRLGLEKNSSLVTLRNLEIDLLINATGTAVIEDLRYLIELQITKKVLCSWNISGCDASLVYGVNEHEYNHERHHVVSASTCTGNAMTPLAYILDKHIGIDYARIITIHPTLSGQHLLDGYHKDSHLGRTQAASIIPTKTNVGASTALALPSLAGKLDSFSYRVPTEIVSVMDISANLSRDTTLEECKELCEHYEKNELAGILKCDYGSWGHEQVSIDFIGTEYSLIILMNYLSVSNGRQIGISLMHDNERGYCCRALDVVGVIERNL